MVVQAYLLARAIQFWTPGVPMVYYVGLLVGSNHPQVCSHIPQQYRRHIFGKFYSWCCLFKIVSSVVMAAAVMICSLGELPWSGEYNLFTQQEMRTNVAGVALWLHSAISGSIHDARGSRVTSGIRTERILSQEHSAIHVG